MEQISLKIVPFKAKSRNLLVRHLLHRLQSELRGMTKIMNQISNSTSGTQVAGTAQARKADLPADEYEEHRCISVRVKEESV